MDDIERNENSNFCQTSNSIPYPTIPQYMKQPALTVLIFMLPLMAYLSIFSEVSVYVFACIVLLLFICGYCSIAYFETVRVQVPYPTENEVIGDRYKRLCTRTSDGQLMEYFEINPSGKHLVIFSHGSSSTGQFALALGMDAVAARLNLRVIAPTGPGFGGTPAYSADIQSNPSMCLETYAADVFKLADELCSSRNQKVACVGISFGSDFGFAVAGEAAKRNRLAVCASVVGSVLPNREFKGWAYHNDSMKLMAWLCSFELFARAFTLAAYAPMMRSIKAAALSGPPMYFNCYDADLAASDFARASKHTMQGLLSTFGSWSSWRKNADRPVPPYYSYIAKSGAHTIVVYGSRDQMSVIANTDYIMNSVPNAELIRFVGHHGQFDLGMVMEKMCLSM